MKETKAVRDRRYKAAWLKAHTAGLAAGNGAKPPTMVVSGLDRNGEPREWIVPEGPCGFAWVNVKPGTSSFARWLKANTRARKAYRGGISYWVHEFGQSVTRKRRFAAAMARVLNEELADDKLDIWPGSRLD